MAIVIERLDQLKHQRAEDRDEMSARFDRMEQTVTSRIDKTETETVARLTTLETSVTHLNTFMNRATGGVIFLATVGAFVAWIADVPHKLWALITGTSAPTT